MREDYQKARHLGEKAYKKAVNEGKFPYLHSLDEEVPNCTKLPRISVGIRNIPLDMIKGTLTAGRQNAFAWNFMPILGDNTEFGTKWSQLYDSQAAEGLREPILVFEYMNHFYVQEGNKRVSVMTYLGASSITGDVQRIMPEESDDPKIPVYKEFLDFFKVTNAYLFNLTDPGAYKQMADIYGQNLTDKWPIEAFEDMRSNYYFFSKVFREKGGDTLQIETGDAFLRYLRIYGTGLLNAGSKAEVGKRITKIWNELLAASEDSDIAMIEEPGPKENKAPGLLNLLTGPAYTAEKPLRAAFIYTKNPDISRWVYGHELGRNSLEEFFEGRVDAYALTDCNTEEKITAAFEAAAEDKADVVFATSPGLMEDCVRAAIKYPNMRIVNCSINLTSSAVRTYYPRMYEAKFLMGALAASLSEDHRIGYLADYPIYASVANINAFAIGAAMIDPYAKIYLKWSGVKNSRWEEEMRDLGLHIISGPDMIRPDEASRKYGLYSMKEDGTVENIAAPIWHWGKYYQLIIQSILDGTWSSRDSVKKSQALNYWYGMSAGVIDVIYSGGLSYNSEKLVQMLKREIISGGISPFQGEIHSQNSLICAAGDPMMSNTDIITMSWLNDNVIGSIPSEDELVDSIRVTVNVSGVTEAHK